MVEDINNILGRLKKTRGIDFSCYRPATLKRRIFFRLAKLGIDDLALYLPRLDDPAECDALIDAISINVSTFFRDPIVFEIISQAILPNLIDNKLRTGSKEIRFWSAGCAAGEEPYSLAILLREFLKKEAAEWALYIFGTDIDNKSLQQAAAASYPRESLSHTKLAILDRYFDAAPDSFSLQPTIRNMVRFSRDDLASSATFAPSASVFGGFDLILCRNVLIYFNRELQELVLNKFLRCLNPGGFLILGGAETLCQDITGFQTLDARNRIFRKNLQ